jgi:hypothetical protein
MDNGRYQGPVVRDNNPSSDLAKRMPPAVRLSATVPNFWSMAFQRRYAQARSILLQSTWELTP